MKINGNAKSVLRKIRFQKNGVKHVLNHELLVTQPQLAHCILAVLKNHMVTHHHQMHTETLTRAAPQDRPKRASTSQTT